MVFEANTRNNMEHIIQGHVKQSRKMVSFLVSVFFSSFLYALLFSSIVSWLWCANDEEALNWTGADGGPEWKDI